MAIFCQQHQSNSAKKCRFVFSILKDPLSCCHSCYRSHVACSNTEEEETTIPDFDDVQKVVVSMIRTRAMEAKFRRKASMLSDSYSSFVHPTSGELFVGIAKPQPYDANSTQKHENSNSKEEMEDFASVKSHFSSPSFKDGSEAYFSVRTNFSLCSSLKEMDVIENRWCFSEVLDSSELKRRAIIQEICHCEGWPFGLCRKALLLPPLPKSPSESWSWCKGFPKIVKTTV